MSFFDDYINPFSNTNSLSPLTQGQGIYNSLKNPRQTGAYLEDRFKHPGLRDVPGFLLGAGTGVLSGISTGQARANANRQDYGQLSDQDLYRMQSTTNRPGDNPFEAQNYDRFSNTYGERHSPRVYATDNSFVFPTTEPVHPNTAAAPITPAPVIVGGGQPTPTAGMGSPEVTAATGTPGAPNIQSPNTVAQAFQIPNRQRRPSARQVV